ncbi:hypothetical protein ACIA5D_36510 [Actinoplanes sp. NPDC051513]|uniref:hypothetical protein n=1 Tax=Actinoplanes sp. NPDC051513 TaxID=3363908 RepID=UPI00378A3282
MTDQQNPPPHLDEDLNRASMDRNDESVIRQGQPADRVTVSAGEVDAAEGVIMPSLTLTPGRTAPPTAPTYRAPMSTAPFNVTTVIAAIDHDRPGLSETKRNLLLFFCQGHELAHSNEPLFSETIYATDNGVDVKIDESSVGNIRDNRLSVVGYVLSRYANLSPADLRSLVQASKPWQLARDAPDNHIEWDWLTDWFDRPDETDDPDDERPTKRMVEAMIAKRKAEGTWPPRDTYDS